MITTMRSEWIKLRSVRVHLVMAVIAAAFPLVLTGLVTALVSDVMTSRDVVEMITGLTVVSAMLLGAVSAISLTSEFSHGTIRPTFAATPAHLRVFVAKLAVNTIVTAGVVSALVVSAWALAAAIQSSRGSSLSVSWDDGTAGAMVAVVALAVIISWFALGLGLVLRNAPATVTLLLVWPLLVESLVAGLGFLIGMQWLPRWMPYAAALSAIEPRPGDDVLGRPVAFVWFGAVSLAIVGLGALLDRRRDA